MAVDCVVSAICSSSSRAAAAAAKINGPESVEKERCITSGSSSGVDFHLVCVAARVAQYYQQHGNLTPH